MGRSKWKGPFTGFEKIKTTTNLKKQLNLMIPRSAEITPKFIGLTVKVHNGKEYQEITITENMTGYKFGEFAFTRAKFSFKKKLNKHGSKNKSKHSSTGKN